MVHTDDCSIETDQEVRYDPLYLDHGCGYTELPVDPKFRARTRIRAKCPNFGILARFLKKGYIFFFNNNNAIAKITFKDDL